MSTDLHTALREAVANAPFDEPDLQAVVDAGSRRVRRRAALVIGSSALAVVAAIVITSVIVGWDRTEPDPLPAGVLRLDLSKAESQDLDVLASVRTSSRDATDGGDDRFLGLTPDGLVLRSRNASNGALHEVGLLDPATGTTDWLPPLPIYPQGVVSLTSDRLVLFAPEHPRRVNLLVLDRGSEAWERTLVRLPMGLESHVPFRLAVRLTVGPDGWVYLGSTYEGESGPLRWWSYAVPEGGDARPEPTLVGTAVAWGHGVEATASNDGRVIVTDEGAEQLLAEERPEACEPTSEPAQTGIPVTMALAGDRPVVTYWCKDEQQPVTLVYDVDGGDAIQVDGAYFLAADEGHVLLAAAGGNPRGTYLLDLDAVTLARIAPSLHEAHVSLAGGLVLWNNLGPLDDKDVYDVLWKVARLPSSE
jgi:hypothetical protein